MDGVWWGGGWLASERWVTRLSVMSGGGSEAEEEAFARVGLWANLTDTEEQAPSRPTAFSSSPTTPLNLSPKGRLVPQLKTKASLQSSSCLTRLSTWHCPPAPP